MKNSLYVLAVLVLAAIPAQASQITYTDSITGLFNLAPDRDLIVPQFNSTLGTLTSVSISASTALQASLGYENTKTTGGTFNIYTYWTFDPTEYTHANVELSFNSSPILTSGYADAKKYTKALSAYDGITDYAGTSGAILANFSDADTTSMLYNSSLAPFIGSGNLTFGLLSNAYTALQTPSNGSTQIATTGQASVSVVYDYTPIPIPEPSTIAILSLGGLLLIKKNPLTLTI